MFGDHRARMRHLFFDAWAKHRRSEPLEPAQRSGQPPDEGRYLTDIEGLARQLGQTL